MKNLIRTTAFLFITFGLFSCAKENSESVNSAQNQILEIRGSIGWCDGGETNPPAVYILPNSLTTNPNGDCCMTFRFLSAYNYLNVSLSTTDYNFNTGLGNPANNSIQHGTISNGLVTFCFPTQGSHILIQIYDSLGNIIACNTIAAPCGE